MKVLVLGANGMAGHVVTRFLQKRKHKVITAARSNADYQINFCKEKEINALLKKESDVDFIINCAGLLVQSSINRPDLAILTNSWLPHHLGHLTKETSTRIVHLSTDCVFDGSKGEYIEDDVPDETNFYGKSKALGELINNKDVTFRTSIIGPENKENGTGLFHWLVNNPDSTVFGWTNVWWNGITTLELARCISLHIENPVATGIYHLVNNNNRISKYHLLEAINKIFDLKKSILKRAKPKYIDKTLIDTKQLVDFQIPNYDIQLAELKNFQNFR